MKGIITYGIFLWLVALLCSCSATKPRGYDLPKSDTVTTVKVDTVWTKNVHADSLLRLIDSLNEDWAAHIDEDFKEPELPGNDLTESVNYWKGEAYKLKAFTKEQAFAIHELTALVNELKARPMLKETRTQTITKSVPENQSLMNSIMLLISGGLAMWGYFKSKKPKA